MCVCVCVVKVERGIYHSRWASEGFSSYKVQGSEKRGREHYANKARYTQTGNLSLGVSEIGSTHANTV